MAPVDVNLGNQEVVWNNLYASVDKPGIKVFTEGDRVRLAQARPNFKKGYTPSWTEELFTVSRINTLSTPITYILKDDSGEELKGSFYKDELQKVGEKNVYRIEYILQTRPRKGSTGKEYLVKWFGYNTAFNSWISDEHLSRYKD